MLHHASLEEILGVELLEGELVMPTREIYRHIYDLFARTFTIFIDLSHLFDGQACMLRFSMSYDRDFAEQWEEIKELKNNANDIVVRDWRKHVQPGECWATVLPQACSSFFTIYGHAPSFAQPSWPRMTKSHRTERGCLTGVGVSISADRSHCLVSLIPSASASASPEDLPFQERLRSFKAALGLGASPLHVPCEVAAKTAGTCGFEVRSGTVCGEHILKEAYHLPPV